MLFGLLIAVLFAPYVVPPFLDRIYYRGPVSDHFDGRRFFNPDRDTAPIQPEKKAGFLRFLFGADRAPWPKFVPVAQTVPPARVAGQAMRVTWIGHSSVLVQTEGLNILTDPIWSDYASPFPPLGPRRVQAPGVKFEDLPKIDLVLISHNHYDHMDLPTLRRLWARDRPLIVTALGNDTILRGHGMDAVTRDWGGRVPIRPGIDVIVERTHHWDSRWAADRNRALWSGFTVTLPGGNLYFAGDTGPGDMSWPAAAAGHGPVRLALLPIGAFRPRELMTGNHIDPVEAVTAFQTLRAAYALGVHWGTFQLTDERIDEPRELLDKTLEARRIALERFRATAVGVEWDVPPMARVQSANSSSLATSPSASMIPNRSASAAR